MKQFAIHSRKMSGIAFVRRYFSTGWMAGRRKRGNTVIEEDEKDALYDPECKS